MLSTGSVPIGVVAVTTSSSTASSGATQAPNFTGISQLRYTRHWSNPLISTTVALEDQSLLNQYPANASPMVDISGTGSATSPAPATTSYVIHRYPAAVARFRVTGANLLDSFQCAALVRPIDVNGANFRNSIATGWGLSLIARRTLNLAQTEVVYAGFVGGQGIGSYIFGGTPAGFAQTNGMTDVTSVRLLHNVAWYASYQHYWWKDEANDNSARRRSLPTAKPRVRRTQSPTITDYYNRRRRILLSRRVRT